MFLCEPLPVAMWPNAVANVEQLTVHCIGRTSVGAMCDILKPSAATVMTAPQLGVLLSHVTVINTAKALSALPVLIRDSDVEKARATRGWTAIIGLIGNFVADQRQANLQAQAFQQAITAGDCRCRLERLSYFLRALLQILRIFADRAQLDRYHDG